MEDSRSSSDPVNVSSTSTCFSGITDAESEDLRRRRDSLAVKTSDAIAIFYALRQGLPSLENANDRGDADQRVEVLCSELNKWQHQAIAFADEFEAEELRRKYKKSVEPRET